MVATMQLKRRYSVFVVIVLLNILGLIDAFPKYGSRIVNGVAVDIKDYPYQVSLQYLNRHNCGGSIISQDWVLTAAHCVVGRSAEDSTIRVGSSFWKEGGDVYNVSEIIMHEKYNVSQFDWDIAVLKITPSISLSDSVKIIPLAESTPAADTDAVATGWGLIAQDATSVPDQLQMIHVPIVDYAQCQQVYGTVLTENMLCAGYFTEAIAICTGDSGGPLVANNVQVGVVSITIYPCDSVPSNPAAYDNVAIYRSWIAEKTGI